MSVYQNLYGARHQFDRNSQLLLSSDYNELDEHMRLYRRANNPEFKEVNPYNPFLEPAFTNNDCYHSGIPDWFKGILNKKALYLYRVDNLSKLLAGRQRDNIVNKKSLRINYSVKKFDGKFINLSEIPDLFLALSRTSEWIPLSDLLITYKPMRGITWWTDTNLAADLTPISVIREANKLGLATNWLNQYSVIMRFGLQESINQDLNIHDIKVPSIIDAFTDPIFHPRKEDDHPTNGTTINLQEIGRPGYNEYISRNIDLSSIELKTVELSKSTKNVYEQFSESEDLYNKIIETILLTKI